MSFENRIVEYGVKRASEFVANPFNWRTHPQSQRNEVRESLSLLGWIDTVIENQATGNLIDGHERVWEALPDDAPVPYLLVNLTEEEEKLALAILDPITGHAKTDVEKLAALLGDVARATDFDLMKDTATLALLEELAMSARVSLQSDGVDDLLVDKTKKPNPRELPIDVIYTLQGADTTCCLAAQAGIRYGIQSASFRLCPYTDKLSGRHDVTFVDNDYLLYDHAKHVEVVARFRPKYATVRDAMTRAQCDAAGIAFFELAQILDYAAELAEYAENVIVIPKYDCLDAIPDEYMLGYSVPSSHGGTPLALRAFAGRRVHLLGGSWNAQLAHMAELGDDVVSLDNNHVDLISRYSNFVWPDGETGNINDDLRLPRATNPRLVALAISFGHMGAKMQELYGDGDVAGLAREEEYERKHARSD